MTMLWTRALFAPLGPVGVPRFAGSRWVCGSSLPTSIYAPGDRPAFSYRRTK